MTDLSDLISRVRSATGPDWQLSNDIHWALVSLPPFFQMGTRFMATKEAPIHDNVKQALVAATELDTRLVMRPLRNTERVLRNAASDALLEKERTLGAALKFDDIIEQVAGVYPKIMLQGAMDAGVWSCGMVAGLIRDVPSCKALIDRIMAEADAIIHQRLAGMAAR